MAHAVLQPWQSQRWISRRTHHCCHKESSITLRHWLPRVWLCFHHLDTCPSFPFQQSGVGSRHQISTFVASAGVLDFAASHAGHCCDVAADVQEPVCNYYLSNKDLKPHWGNFPWWQIAVRGDCVSGFHLNTLKMCDVMRMSNTVTLATLVSLWLPGEETQERKLAKRNRGIDGSKKEKWGRMLIREIYSDCSSCWSKVTNTQRYLCYNYSGHVNIIYHVQKWDFESWKVPGNLKQNHHFLAVIYPLYIKPHHPAAVDS